MKRFTNAQKVAGELACRRLSGKAERFYDSTDPFTVYEYTGDDGNALYAYTGGFGEKAGLTFEQLQSDLEAIDDDVTDLLDLIEMLVNESYEDYQIYEAEINMPLWHELCLGFGGEALAAFNAEIIVLASLIESKQGTDLNDTLICSINDEELTDPDFASYAYSIVHDYLISLSSEQLEQFAETGFGLNSSKGELYKLHFNLFA